MVVKFGFFLVVRLMRKEGGGEEIEMRIEKHYGEESPFFLDFFNLLILLLESYFLLVGLINVTSLLYNHSFINGGKRLLESKWIEGLK